MMIELLQKMSRDRVFYLASPYTHPDPEIRSVRARLAAEASGRLLHLGIKNFSPIAYCHPFAEEYGLPTDADWWWKFNLAFMMPSPGLLILEISGWQDSYGVKLETNWYKGAGLPIFFVKFTEDDELVFRKA